MPRDMHPKANHLGATIYTPIINPGVARLMRGESYFNAGSAVACLEDALHENDIPEGLSALKAYLSHRKTEGFSTKGAMAFVRPRSLDMARHIADMIGSETLDGFVAPKFEINNAEKWLQLSKESNIPLMPTLETGECFDPICISELRAICDTARQDDIVALRVGGNDLMHALGIRKTPGVSHFGPLSYVMNMISSQFMAAGYAVCAPVFEVIQDVKTLKEEVEMDVARGYAGKTAIHPTQIPIIQAALCPSFEDVAAARMILDKDAKAVFQFNGAMCEPATHARWAKRVLARAEKWNEHAQPVPIEAGFRLSVAT